MTLGMFARVYKAGLRLTGYGVMAVGVGIAALAYVRLVLKLNDTGHHADMLDKLSR